MTVTFISITADEVHDGLLEISGPRYHHLIRVRRLALGDRVHGALPDGHVLHTEIAEITPRLLRARVVGKEQAIGLSPCRITLYQAVLKGDKMDLVVQKATELGVQTLVPLLAHRSVPRWAPAQAEERVQRWQRIAESAAEQSERSVPLRVAPVCGLTDALTAPSPLALVLSERSGVSLRVIAARHPLVSDIALYLGPEGGWAEEEMTALMAARAEPLHLGRRILRAETASLVAVTLVQYQWGDLAALPAASLLE